MQNQSSHTGSKLKSLLVLSAGAAALPQAGHAAIIYSGALNEQVGFSPGYAGNYLVDLPGSNDIQVFTQSNPGLSYAPEDFPATARVTVQGISFAQIKAYYPSAGLNFAKRASAGATWDTIAGSLRAGGDVGLRRGTPGIGAGPGDFTGYVAFQFTNTDVGAVQYGWLRLSMTVSEGVGPDVTILGFAYDDTGEKIEMGAVPEPSSAALVAFGALAFGGVRRWRASKRSA